MATNSTKSKKNRQPTNTSALSQPVVEDGSSLNALPVSAFSAEANLFAFLSLSADKHRLRIYDTSTAKSVAEHVVDSGRISTLIWGSLDLFEGPSTSVDENIGIAKKKGKRKRPSTGAEEKPKTETEVVVLGLTDGTLLFFSPSHGRILRTLSHPTSTAAILSITLTYNEESGSTLWTSGADGVVRLWDARRNNITGSWKIDDRIPYTSLAARPKALSGEDGHVELLVANHSIRLISTLPRVSDSSDFEVLKPKLLASFTGHASSINRLQWDASQEPSSRFISTAESDRFIYVWDVPRGTIAEGKIVLSISLDSNVRRVSLSTLTTPSSSSSPPYISKPQSILALSTSGKISIYPIPSELTPPATSEKTKHKVPALLPRSNVNVLSKKASSGTQVIDASFILGEVGKIKVARVVGGVRPVFHVVVSI